MPKLTKKMPKLSRRKDGTFYTRVAGKQINLRKDPQEARRQYNQIIAEIAANRVSVRGSQRSGIPISSLCVAFLQAHEQSRDYNNYRRSIRNLVNLYGGNNTRDFGPLALKSVRESFATDGNQRKSDAPISRQYANKLTGMIRTIFSWGVSNEMVPPEVLVGLRAVRAIEKTHSQSPESKPVKPISDATIDATLPELSRTVAAMVRIQRLTGMRPSEVCEMRESEIDYSGATWIYRKADHKNTWRGQDRIVPLGPQARAILSSFIDATSDGNDYLFSPIRAQEERYAELRAARKSKVQPSQVSRKKATTKAALGDFYSEESYCRAISRAAKRAGAEHWFPYQIRHTAATKIRERHGIEGSQVLLGHATIDASQIYAERNLAEAIKIAENEG